MLLVAGRPAAGSVQRVERAGGGLNAAAIDRAPDAVLLPLAKRGGMRPEVRVLFCGMASGLPLESNGLRVLVRIGWGPLQKNYGSMYRTVQSNIAPVLPHKAEKLKEAFLLLREHGRGLCKDKSPLCSMCPLAAGCD